MHRTDLAHEQKKVGVECNRLSNMLRLQQHRFGSGDMPFSVWRVSFQWSMYTGNSIASAEKNNSQNILFE